ncbi:MAG TPA: cytochrome c [Steroidobacteraceae bacterium]|nr:cytochrome c [Steroidobacteraceae bacterium]
MSKVGTRFHFRNRVARRAQPRTRIVQALAVALMWAATQWATAQGAPRPESLIKWRQSAYQVIAWNSGRIKAALAGQFDSHEVQNAANALAAVANSGLAGLFAPGTAHGKGWRETTARDEVFSDAGKFRALTEEFAREASALARVAAAGDRNTVNAQFLKVAQTCKSCHNQFRQAD